MSHIDKFGREWKYTPGNNPNRMLKLTHSTASIGWPKLLPHHEPYLLRMTKGWSMGIRYGNEGHEYLSPGLEFQEGNLIERMLAHHDLYIAFCDNTKERGALIELMEGA